MKFVPEKASALTSAPPAIIAIVAISLFKLWLGLEIQIKMSSFIQFVLDNQLPIAKDVKKPWFKKVWLPLTMRQFSVKNRAASSGQLPTTRIVSSSDFSKSLDPLDLVA